MKNAIVSSTRQWNCGDEFIRSGCQNLIEAALGGTANWTLYDRNPDVLGKEAIWGNSWRGESLDRIDFAVFAGTPEWYGAPVRTFCAALLTSKVRAIYLGVGGAVEPIPFGPEDLACLKASPLVVCRDETAACAVRKVGVAAFVLPCPAFYVHPRMEPKKGGRPSRVGVSFQLPRTVNQRVDERLSASAVRMMEDLGKRYNVAAICHYKDEYFHALREGWPVLYSFDAADYERFYTGFDAVVSTRLHGAVLAASCGTPAYCVNRSLRTDGAAALFPGMSCNMEEVPAVLKSLEMERESARLMDLKRRTRTRYVDLIREAIG